MDNLKQRIAKLEKEAKQKRLGDEASKIKIRVLKVFLDMPDRVSEEGCTRSLNLQQQSDREIYFKAVWQEINRLEIHLRHQGLIWEAYWEGKKLVLENFGNYDTTD